MNKKQKYYITFDPKTLIIWGFRKKSFTIERP